MLGVLQLTNRRAARAEKLRRCRSKRKRGFTEMCVQASQLISRLYIRNLRFTDMGEGEGGPSTRRAKPSAWKRRRAKRVALSPFWGSELFLSKSGHQCHQPAPTRRPAGRAGGLPPSAKPLEGSRGRAAAPRQGRVGAGCVHVIFGTLGTRQRSELPGKAIGISTFAKPACLRVERMTLPKKTHELPLY
ncbi:hypothetical protein CVT26_009683 [Gymnopilus dilepis]|uniref:Uncharacterized protein n=1 Tax=Gymnopilus dilepis TaxID=231916 RepID=A0A409YBT7_9AGAR|nr:hypothetical protein CVT26_009683 [Gymnopilus dilepis]